MAAHNLADFFTDREISYILHPPKASKFFGTESEASLFTERLEAVFGRGNGLEVLQPSFSLSLYYFLYV